MNKTGAHSKLTDNAMRALHAAVGKVIEDHRRRGRPLAVWRDGQAVWMPVPSVGAAREKAADYTTKSHGARS